MNVIHYEINGEEVTVGFDIDNEKRYISINYDKSKTREELELEAFSMLIDSADTSIAPVMYMNSNGDIVKRQNIEVNIESLEDTIVPFAMKQGDTQVHEISISISPIPNFTWDSARVFYSNGGYQDINELTFIMKNSALAIAGKRSLEIEFKSGEKTRRTGKIRYMVKDSINADIQAYDKYEELDEIYNSYVNAMENEGVRQTNEAERNRKEDIRASNESQRVRAEEGRVIAEDLRGIRLTDLENELTEHKEEFTTLNGEERLTTLEESKIKKYGVKFLGSNPVGERLYDAVGMIANVATDDEIVVNDFDDISFYDRPICNVYFDTNGNPQVMAYRGEPGFSFEGGIFPPYAEKSDVYYECSPCGWNGSFDTPVVTGTPMEGFELFECFPDWNTKIYLPTFFMGMEDGRPTSRSGVAPGYYSINTAFTTAQAWNTNAHGETINAHMYEYILQCIEFATRDLQTVMHGVGTLTYNSATDLALISETGVNRIILARADNYAIGQTIVVGTARNGTDITGERIVTSIEPYDEDGQALYFDGEPVNIKIGNFVSSRAYKNGATDIVIASSGSPVDNNSGKYPCIWRGKADPWGNGYSGISDLLTKRYGAGTPEDPYTYKLCYLKDPKKYANGVITSDYIELNYNLSTSDGYAKELGQDTRFPLIGVTKEVGAASTTYYADYYYYPRYDVGAVCVGGLFASGRNAGPLFFYCYSTPALVTVYRLARLFVTPF